MNDYHISRVRLAELSCARCRNHISKGSYCLFTDTTYTKICLNCVEAFLEEHIKFYKNKIKDRRGIIARVKRNKEKWNKYNVACSVCA